MVYLVSYETYIHVLAAQLQMNFEYQVFRSKVSEMYVFESWAVCRLEAWRSYFYFLIKKE